MGAERRDEWQEENGNGQKEWEDNKGRKKKEKETFDQYSDVT